MQDVTIERLGLEGDGTAGSLRVPFALPGERLRGEVVDGVLTSPELLSPSPQRIAPLCAHFGSCGGCALQHASDGFVAAWKQVVVARALAARGLTADLRPVATSPARSRRRAVLAGRRTRGAVEVGFHERRSGIVVDIHECYVVRPEILAAKPTLAALTGLAAARGATVRIGVTCGPAGLDVEVGEAKPFGTALAGAVAAVAETANLARVSWNGEVVALRHPPLQPIGRSQVVPPPGGFLQATAEGAAALTAAVHHAVGDARRVADLFAGCGTFALPLAETAEVAAVDGDAAAIAALDAGWRHSAGLRRVTAERRDLFRRPLLAAELAPFGAVVLDPPRAGAEAQARELAASKLPRIAMVSCNPVSFARDAAILAAGGYRLDWIQVVDQFRWSPQIELAASFRR